MREAVTAAKVGNKAAARQLLRQASVHNPNNELVWLWRASLSESPKEAIFYLGEVLRINPQNQKAAAWLEKCKGVTGGGAQAPEGPKPVGQNLSQPPAPGTNNTAGAPPAAARQAVPAANTFGAAQTHTNEVLKTVEGVGTTTIRPTEQGPGSMATGRAADPMVIPRPADTATRARPTVIPFAPASKGSPALALEPEPQPRWRCPFCQAPSESALRRCPNCRAVTVLEDLKEIEKNEGVQEKLVRDSLARYEATPADKRGFDQNVSLALGHLNLREATAALPHLKAASAQKRNDWALNGVLDQIQWRKVILVVDDSLTIRKALSSILEKNDYRVVTAEDGSHALAKLNEAVPDLVLLDITMPWMDGYEVCKAIKQKALTRKVPVIMLSGKDGLFDKVRGKLAGCNDYVTKPFDPDALLKTIKKYLSGGA
ncbi:MAG: response regulator [Bryobacterales bacterium]|nr:response regulator [Bryobacterales bacterium]